MATTAAHLVAEAKATIENLTVEEASKEIDSSERILVVDLREPDEREQNGAIPDTHHAPRGMLEFWGDPTSPYHREEFQPDRRIILYCASGGRSALATVTLRQLGYQNVAHLDGGFKAWAEAGCPVGHDV